MEYKYEVTSLVGFLQRVATHLLPKGYYFFVQGTLPEGKDPTALDEKLLSKYDVAKTKGLAAGERARDLGTSSTFASRDPGFSLQRTAITPSARAKGTTSRMSAESRSASATMPSTSSGETTSRRSPTTISRRLTDAGECGC